MKRNREKIVKYDLRGHEINRIEFNDYLNAITLVDEVVSKWRSDYKYYELDFIENLDHTYIVVEENEPYKVQVRIDEECGKVEFIDSELRTKNWLHCHGGY